MAEPRLPRWVELGFAGLVAAGAAYSAWGVWHDRRLAERFEAIHLGMDRGSVEAALGGPDWEGGCGTHVPTLPRADCVREIGYASAFAPLVYTYYPIQLDRHGRVIEADVLHR